MAKLEDTKAACNLIKQMRDYDKTLIKKEICTSLRINDIKLRNKVTLVYNPATGVTSVSCKGIGYKSVSIYPTTHQKLKCINLHGLDKLKNKRKLNKEYMKKRRELLKDIKC